MAKRNQVRRRSRHDRDYTSPLNNIITIDDERIKNHLDRVVRGSVEETLNALLDAEADRLCNAQRYERSAARRDTRAGHYERNLQTKAGEVRLKVPKLRQQTFETAIIERYRRRESSSEEALIEMYLAGVSVRRVEDITEALWDDIADFPHACCSRVRRSLSSDFLVPPNIKLSGASFLPPPLPNSDYCVLSKRRCAPCPKVSAIKSANATSVRRNAGTGLKLPHRHRYETITSRWSAVGCRWPAAMNSRSS